MERTTYASRVNQQAAQEAQIDRVHFTVLMIVFRGFDDHRVMSKSGIVHDQSKCFSSDKSATDMSVTIEPAGQRPQTVI